MGQRSDAWTQKYVYMTTTLRIAAENEKNAANNSHFDIGLAWRNMSRHTLMGLPDARLEMMDLAKQMYVLIQNVGNR